MNDKEIYEYEIRRLKAHIQYLEDRNFIYREEKLKYQERVIKAIEYLTYASCEEKETPSKHNDWKLDLLEILKGEHIDGK